MLIRRLAISALLLLSASTVPSACVGAGDGSDAPGSGGSDAVMDLPYVPLKDEAGRTLILHGANFMAVEYGGSPIDYERMARWGFNVVRILMTWQALEPLPGVFDEAYLPEVVEKQVAYAHEAGLRVILDMHQFHWSSCSGGMGMPDWTCQDLGAGPFDWLLQSGRFWDHPEYVDGFVAAWARVAEHFAGDDRIFAYDLFNEPMAGLRSLPWTSENQLYRPLYERLIETIRSRHPEPYLMIEPSVPSVAGLPFVMKPLEGERLIYSPHVYPRKLAEGGGYDFPRSLLQRHIDLRQRETLEHRLPLFIGETGLASSSTQAEQYARDVTDLFESKLALWAWWAFGYDDDSMGLCDAAGNPKEMFLRHLSRPYPQATSGVLRSFHYDPKSRVFAVTFDNTGGMKPEVEIFVNAGVFFPTGFLVSSTDGTGTWRYSFDDATGKLVVVCNPKARSHTVTIAPSIGS